MNISERFIKWVKLLFENTTAAVNLNGCPCNNFRVEKGVRYECPIAPYLFLILGEPLTHIIQKTVIKGILRGITLPGGKKQQSTLVENLSPDQQKINRKALVAVVT